MPDDIDERNIITDGKRKRISVDKNRYRDTSFDSRSRAEIERAKINNAKKQKTCSKDSTQNPCPEEFTLWKDLDLDNNDETPTNKEAESSGETTSCDKSSKTTIESSDDSSTPKDNTASYDDLSEDVNDYNYELSSISSSDDNNDLLSIGTYIDFDEIMSIDPSEIPLTNEGFSINMFATEEQDIEDETEASKSDTNESKELPSAINNDLTDDDIQIGAEIIEATNPQITNSTNDNSEVTYDYYYNPSSGYYHTFYVYPAGYTIDCYTDELGVTHSHCNTAHGSYHSTASSSSSSY